MRGADASNGISRRTAWKTLSHVNRAHPVPGDQLLFKSADVRREALVPDASGGAKHPIVFARYGNGPLPLIAAGGKAENAVRLYNVQYVDLRSLAITNHGKAAAIRCGVDVVLDNFGTAPNKPFEWRKRKVKGAQLGNTIVNLCKFAPVVLIARRH